jgi:hypothetical protein
MIGESFHFCVAKPSPKTAVNPPVKVKMRSVLCGIAVLYHSSKMEAKESCQTSARPELVGFEKARVSFPLRRSSAASRRLSKGNTAVPDVDVGKIPLAQRTRLRKAE